MATPQWAQDACMTPTHPARVDRIAGKVTLGKLRELSRELGRDNARPASGNWFIAVSHEQEPQALMLPNFVPAARYGDGSMVRAAHELGTCELFRFVVES